MIIGAGKMENREKLIEDHKRWSREHPYSTYSEKAKKQRMIRNKKYLQKAKVEALTYYGAGKLACVNCGFEGRKGGYAERRKGVCFYAKGR